MTIVGIFNVTLDHPQGLIRPCNVL